MDPDVMALFPENIIPKILNHTESGVTRRHYNLHAYRSEKRAALETWARYLQTILANKRSRTGSVVIPAMISLVRRRKSAS